MDNTNKAITNKAITFTGKHNIDQINQLTDGHIKAKRTHMETLPEMSLTHRAQEDMLHKLYMKCDFPFYSLLEKELNKKVAGYKAQDMKKNIYDSALLITTDDTIEKLISAKLHCHYCKMSVALLYKNVREPTQWTLDRIDNSKCHSKENTVISCLKCNLQRRVTHIDKFLFTKQLKICKK